MLRAVLFDVDFTLARPGPELGPKGYVRAGERHGLRRQFLHSHRLQLTHPLSGERMEFHLELPADLAQALALARSPA